MSEIKLPVEHIISPAPAQSSLLLSSDRSLLLSNDNKQDNEERGTEIKILTKRLRTINNICDGIKGNIEFQKCMSAENKVLVEVNQWITLMYTMRTYIKNSIDSDYMDIIEPPQSLKHSMSKTYTVLDDVSAAFSNSMRDIVLMSQMPKVVPMDIPACSQSAPSQSDNMNILESMI